MLFQTCADGSNCDQSSGACLEILPECASEAPGYAFCTNDALEQCGPDRVTIATVSCTGRCQGGACQPPVCGDGKVQGSEECDDGNTIPADGCEPDCKLSRVVQLAAGATHTCALFNEGNIRCWGGNRQGQLGLGNATDLSGDQPYQIGLVKLGAPAAAITAGAQHTCALMVDGSVRCWGQNDLGQLGLGNTNNIGDDEAPTAQNAQVELGTTVTAVVAGGNDTCVIMADGSARCWGENESGQLGLGNTNTIGDNEIPSASVATVGLDDTVRAPESAGAYLRDPRQQQRSLLGPEQRGPTRHREHREHRRRRAPDRRSAVEPSRRRRRHGRQSGVG